MSPDLTANHKMSGAGLRASRRSQLSWVGADSWISSHPPLSLGNHESEDSKLKRVSGRPVLDDTVSHAPPSM